MKSKQRKLKEVPANFGVRKWEHQGYVSPLAKKVNKLMKKYLTNRK